MSKRVRWSNRALRELRGHVGYIANDNPEAAQRTKNLIQQTGANLKDFNIGRRGEAPGTLKKVVLRTPYILVYEVLKEGRSRIVHILLVVHGAQNWARDLDRDHSED